MAQKPTTPDEHQATVDWVAQHKNIGEAAHAAGIPDATLRNRWRKATAAGFVARALAAQATRSPPTKAVPDGFHLSQISTTVDSDGVMRSQSFKAKSGEEGDLVPESGNFPAPDGMYVRSVSTLVDGQTGVVKQQWVKADILKQDQWNACVEASLRAAEKVVPRDHVYAPLDCNEKLCTLYTLTDCHVGMLAWGKEAGEPWDLDIARDCLVNTFRAMLDAAPKSRIGIVNQLGDFLHFDSLKPVTPEHGHLLDADSRYQKMVETAVEILCEIVDAALLKHEIVQVYMHEGNHDPAGSVWLRVMFSKLYRNNPRVSVGMEPLPYVAFQHGNTLLGFHHGHLAKNESLPQLFAAKFRRQWGECPKVYIHTGHRHHVEEKEFPGAKVIQHPTLAAADAYAARGGWLSERQVQSITYHADKGEYARGIFLPE